MNRSRPRCRNLNCRGQAVLEMAFLLPILLVIVLTCVEFSNMLTVSLRVSNLSREIANATFRDCAYLTSSNLAPCLSERTNRLATEAELILPGFQQSGTVRASAYQHTSGIQLLATRASGGGGYVSQYNTSSVDSSVVAAQDRIVIGEIFYPYTPITPVGYFLNSVNFRKVIYEVTIF